MQPAKDSTADPVDALEDLSEANLKDAVASYGDLHLEVEPIPAGSSALRMITANKEVKFVCISSPMEKKSEKYFWLGYGEMSVRVRKLVREYLRITNTNEVNFTRIKNSGRKVLNQNHKLKKRTQRGLLCVLSTLLAVSVTLNLFLWLVG